MDPLPTKNSQKNDGPEGTTKTAGIPIKDRGIHWQEKYTDKSAYLKEQFDKQVGPGSYFRWEGHDHVTGADYYTVVTPGYSKKHGYHFFAALRKMPAENGASGKKFKTQGEAMSYAIDKWRVPPPQEPPAARYTADDLVGKPIVTENVHASNESKVVVAETKEEPKPLTIIDASESPDHIEKEAMSLPVTGPLGMFYPSQGSKTNATNMRFAAAAGSIMGYGAALGMNKEWGLVDVYNQGEGELLDVQSGKMSEAIHPMVATCQPPHEARFREAVVEGGHWKLNRLFKINKKKGTVDARKPAYDADSQGEQKGYRIIRFADAKTIPVDIVVSGKHKGKWDELWRTLANSPSPLVNADGTQVLEADGSPLLGYQAVENGTPQFEQDGSPRLMRSPNGSLLQPMASKFVKDRGGNATRVIVRQTESVRPGHRGNWRYRAQVPIDVFSKFKTAITGSGSIEPLDFKSRNIVDLYAHYERQGEAETQGDFDQIMNTPVFEAFDMKGGRTVVYDGRGWPIGIKISDDNRIDKEAFSEGGQRTMDVQYEFAPGVVEEMLGRPEIGGDLQKLRWALAKEQIPLEHGMFRDVRTCPPMTHRIKSVLDRLDGNMIPQLDENGRLVKERRDLTPAFTANVTRGKIRVYDPERNAQVVVPLDQAEQYGLTAPVQPEQTMRGCQVIIEHAKQYVPVMTVDPATGHQVESLHEIDAGEIKRFNAAGAGQIVPGNHYTIMAKAARLSSKRSDIKTVHELEQERIGIYLGYKETYATMKYVAGAPKNDVRNFVSIVMKDGRVLQYPSDRTPDDPAVQAVAAAIADPNAAAIEGYYYSHQRQHPPKPMTTAKPTDAKPLLVQRTARMPDGSIRPMTDSQGNPVNVSLGASDVFAGTGRSPTYFKNMKGVIGFLQARLAMTNGEIGRWTDCDISDYRAVDDKLREATARIAAVKAGEMPEASLEEWEQVYSKFDPTKDAVPNEFLALASRISPDNPADFAPKRGRMYRILDETGSPATPELFVTQSKAMEVSQAMTEDAPDRHFTVTAQRDAELVPSIYKARIENPNAPPKELAKNIDVSVAVAGFADFGQGEEVNEEQASAAQEDQESTGDGETMDPESPEEPEEADDNEAAVPQPAAEAPAEPAPMPEPEPVPPIAVQPTVQAPPPEEPKPAPAPVVPIISQPEQKAPSFVPKWRTKPPPPVPQKKPDHEAAAMQRLVKLANKLDDQGKVEEANAVDRLIALHLSRLKNRQSS